MPWDGCRTIAGVQLPTGTISVNGYTWTAPREITLPGGTTRSHTYDPLLRLKTIAVKDPAQNQLMNYQYGYDRADNITTKTTEHGSYSYGYDSLYRLISAQAPSPLLSETYTYDPAGNRETDSNRPGAHSYNANNQLNQAAGTTYTYDDNGNTTTRTEGNTITTYVYDIDDRLIEVRTTDTQSSVTQTIATYRYDPYGRRISKDTNNARTWFFYSDEGLIAEAGDTGSIARQYGYKPESTFTTDALYLKSNNSYYFFQNDHLGTSQQLVGQDGTIVWKAKAQVFGETSVDVASTVVNNLRFAGQYFDAESGLHYNWNRYYDPRTGRYITSDPIGLAGGLNTYVYADGNALNHIDEQGLNSYAPGYTKSPQGIGQLAAGIYNRVCWAVLTSYLERMDKQIDELRKKLAPCTKMYCQKSVLFHHQSQIGRCVRDFALACGPSPVFHYATDSEAGTWGYDPPIEISKPCC